MNQVALVESFWSCRDLMKTADGIEAALGIGVQAPFKLLISERKVRAALILVFKALRSDDARFRFLGCGFCGKVRDMPFPTAGTCRS